MTRRRFIANTWNAERTTAALTGEQAHHLAQVLRATPGQVYDVVAGGFLHRAEITAVSEGMVALSLKEELEAEAALPLHLLLAVFKFDPMEWAIEKATELGAARITPILARRTEKHLAQAASKRVERWRRIALEAAKQSRRTDVPEIGEPAGLKQVLAEERSATRILLSETEQGQTLASVLAAGTQREIALAVGPEGGWTPEEMALFAEYRWQSVTLGSRILRAETAAVAAIAVVGAWVG